MKKAVVFACLLFSCLGYVGAQDTITVKTYPVYASEPEALVQALRDVFGDKLKITYYKPVNQLIITGQLADQEIAAALLKDINIPSRNVRIDVQFVGAGSTSEDEASLGGAGEVVLDKNGASYNVKLNPKLKSQSGTETDNARQTLLVQSGREATLFVGKEVPYAEWLYDVARDWGYIRQEFKMKPVGSSLVVRPQIGSDGKLISVTLIPELSAIEEDTGKLERIRYTRVATQVMIADGATISIGGAVKDKEFYNKFLVGLSKGGEKRKVDISLTAHIEDAGGNRPNNF